LIGITAYEDTFKSKNNYENILIGINKEGVCVFLLDLPKQTFLLASPTNKRAWIVESIEDYRQKYCSFTL
jgi:hypothetical protein